MQEPCFGCSEPNCFRQTGSSAPAHVRGLVVGALIGGIFGGPVGALVGGGISMVAHAVLAGPIDKAWCKVTS